MIMSPFFRFSVLLLAVTGLHAVVASDITNELDRFDFYPLVTSPVGVPQIAARMHARGTVVPVTEAQLKIDTQNQGIHASPQALMVAFWRALGKGDLAQVLPLYAPDAQAVASERFADGGMAAASEMHLNAQHSIIHRTLIGDFVIVAYLTKQGAKTFVWEETLRLIGNEWFICAALPTNSFPMLVMRSIAERQSADHTRTVAVDGMKIVPISITAKIGDAVALVGASSLNEISIAIRGMFPNPIVLEQYAGDDAALLFIKGVRTLYSNQAPVAGLNDLWRIRVGESKNADKPIDPLYWYGSEKTTEVLGRLAGPQGAMFICRRAGSEDAMVIYTTQNAGTFRLATGLIASNGENSDEWFNLNELLNSTAVTRAVLNAP
jgi:hypothetical protein